MSSAAFGASGCSDFSVTSPATRRTSGSNHLSFVVSTAVIASSMQRRASSNSPRSAWALANCDKRNGSHMVDPVDRHAAIPEVSIWTAAEGLPATAKAWPRAIMAPAFQNNAAVSSANAAVSSASAVASAANCGFHGRCALLSFSYPPIRGGTQIRACRETAGGGLPKPADEGLAQSRCLAKPFRGLAINA